MVFNTGLGQIVTFDSSFADFKETHSDCKVSSLTMIGECNDFSKIQDLLAGFNLWQPHVSLTIVTPESTQTFEAKCLGVPSSAQDYNSIHNPTFAI